MERLGVPVIAAGTPTLWLSIMWEILVLALLRRLTYNHRDAASEVGAQIVYYRTKDGNATYCFSIESQRNRTFRCYLVLQPRESVNHVAHILRDHDGRRFVCWDSPLRTADEARQVAAAWADKTQRYVRTGISF
jgi:hypothetical protein